MCDSRGGCCCETEAAKENPDICWGRNAVISMLESAPDRCVKVLIAKNIQPYIRNKIQDLCRKVSVACQSVEPMAIYRIAKNKKHQGVAAYIAPILVLSAEELIRSLSGTIEESMVILCDHIQDPHNIGAIIRSAEAAGASGVLIPKRGGCRITGTVLKTSAGASARLPIGMMGNVSQTIRLLQEAGFWVIGLDMNGRDTLLKSDMPERLVIVIGAEGEGLGSAVAKACDDIRYIPMKGLADSLNASVAAALAMFEWVRTVSLKHISEHKVI